MTLLLVIGIKKKQSPYMIYIRKAFITKACIFTEIYSLSKKHLYFCN